MSAAFANKPLAGKHVLLLFQFDLSYSIRTIQSVEALKQAGATISLVTGTENSKSEHYFSQLVQVDDYEFNYRTQLQGSTYPQFIKTWYTKLATRFIPKERIFGHRVGVTRLNPDIWSDIDLIWAVDVVSLPAAHYIRSHTGAPLIYETYDLVPEYPYYPELSRWRREQEVRALGYIDGLVTAGEEYRRYYHDTYPFALEGKEILVRDNVALPITSPHPVESRLKFLFFGNIAHDRPVEKILSAFIESGIDAELTIQGRNITGETYDELVATEGAGTVRIAEPCAPVDGVEAASHYDVGIVALDGNDLNEQYAPTGKIGTYLAAGMVVLASNLPGIRAHLGEAGAITVEGNSKEAWIQAFQSAAQLNAEEIMTMKEASLARCRAMDLEGQLHQFVRLFARVAEKGVR